MKHAISGTLSVLTLVLLISCQPAKDVSPKEVTATAQVERPISVVRYQESVIGIRKDVLVPREVILDSLLNEDCWDECHDNVKYCYCHYEPCNTVSVSCGSCDSSNFAQAWLTVVDRTATYDPDAETWEIKVGEDVYDRQFANPYRDAANALEYTVTQDDGRSRVVKRRADTVCNVVGDEWRCPSDGTAASGCRRCPPDYDICHPCLVPPGGGEEVCTCP